MADLAKIDDGIRPALLAGPLQFRLVTTQMQGLVLAWGVGALLAELFLYSQLANEGFTAVAWARFVLPQILIIPFALRAARRYLRDRSGTLEFSELGIRLTLPRNATEEVRYSDIREYRLGTEAGYWLRIETWDGRQLVIPKNVLPWSGVPVALVAKTMGPRLSPEVRQERGPIPLDPFLRYVWSHFDDPPPVTMVPGRRYRYVDRKCLYEAKGDFSGVFMATPVLLHAVYFISKFGFAANATYLVACLTAVGFVFLQAGMNLWRAILLYQAGNDRFVLTPEGIRVSRDVRSWILRDPRPAKGFLWSLQRYGRPFHRYGRGLDTYFFDPRFLKEDKPV